MIEKSMINFFTILLIVFCWVSPCYGLEYQLRVNTEMHTAPIWDLVVDESRGWVYTAGEDGLVKQWHLGGGKYRRTIDLPNYPTPKGKLFSLGLSHDANTLAVGGATSKRKGHYLVHLIALPKADRLVTFKALPNVINVLAFSPDSRFLAVGLGGRSGLRVFDVKSQTIIAQDEDYNQAIHSLVFDSSGRLWSASADGTITRYDSQFRREARQVIDTVGSPYRLSLNSQTRKLTLSFIDEPRLLTIDAISLEVEGSPDLSRIDNGDLASVAWSQDGKRLYAGGSFDINGGTPIIIWNTENGKRAVSTVARNRLSKIFPLSSGGFLFATHDPSWGRYSRKGDLLYVHEARVTDHREQDQYFKVSADGRRITWRNRRSGKLSSFVFALTRLFFFTMRGIRIIVFYRLLV